MQQLKRLLAILLSVCAVSATAQQVIGGAGRCHVNGNPNNISSMQSIDVARKCTEAYNPATGETWTYVSTLPSGSRWAILAVNSEPDTAIIYESPTQDSFLQYGLRPSEGIAEIYSEDLVQNISAYVRSWFGEIDIRSKCVTCRGAYVTLSAKQSLAEIGWRNQLDNVNADSSFVRMVRDTLTFGADVYRAVNPFQFGAAGCASFSRAPIEGDAAPLGACWNDTLNNINYRLKSISEGTPGAGPPTAEEIAMSATYGLTSLWPETDARHPTFQTFQLPTAALIDSVKVYVNRSGTTCQLGVSLRHFYEPTANAFPDTIFTQPAIYTFPNFSIPSEGEGTVYTYGHTLIPPSAIALPQATGSVFYALSFTEAASGHSCRLVNSTSPSNPYPDGAMYETDAGTIDKVGTQDVKMIIFYRNPTGGETTKIYNWE